MTENQENEGFSIEESLKILKDTGKQIEKEQKEFKKKVVPLTKRKGEDIYEVDADKAQLKSLEKQYSILLSSAMRFVNPLLKKRKIDPLNSDEINTLSKAILEISESNIKKTVKKIEKRYTSIGKAMKWLNLLAVFWELGVPRSDQLKASVVELEAKRKGMVKS